MTRALLVGLGTIARTHAAVLAGRDDVELLGGVDPRPTDWFDGVRWASLDEALEESRPDLVVLATPTDTHVDLVDRLLSSSEARVLSEKPLAATVADLDRLVDAHGDESLARRLAVAHHFAFSPEVVWGRDLARLEDWGAPSSVVSTFHDAYVGLPSDRLDSVVSSWVDSGPNQLSVLAAFCDPADDWRVVTHTARRDRAVTRLTHRGGSTVLSSNWVAGDSSKQTTLEFLGGAVRLRLDHTSMTAMLFLDGAPTEHVGYAGTAGRKEAHYRGLYDTLLAPGGTTADDRLGVPLARMIATILDAAATDAPGDPGLAFSELS